MSDTNAPSPAPSPAPSSAGPATQAADRRLSVEAAIRELGARRAAQAAAPPPPPANDNQPAAAQPGGPPEASLPPAFDPLNPDAPPPAANDDQADDQAPDDQAGDDQAPAAGEVELQHEGQVVRVPVARAVELAQQGLDYTRKTQALAEQRRALEQQRAELNQAWPIVQHHLQQMTDAAKAKAQPLPPPAEFEKLQKDDPWAAMQLVMGHLHAQQVEATQRQAEAAWTQQQQRQLQDHLAQQEQLLAKHIPAWSDPAKRKAIQGELMNAGQVLGFGPDELATVYDHRMVRVLLLAARQMRAEQHRPQPGLAAPAPIPRPANDNGKWPVPAHNKGVALGAVRRAEERLTKEGSIDAAVAALQARRGLRRTR